MISTDEIFKINDDIAFEKTALSLFEFHFDKNPVYRTYCEHIGINKNNVDDIERIPFLPIHTFKSHKIIVDDFLPEKIFLSSGTTNSENLSKHYVADLKIYEKSYQKAFEKFYGDIADYTVLALLPSYLERSGSSLIYMTNDFINQSKNHQSAFYLNEYDKLAEVLVELNANNTKTLLIGVSYALLDFAEKYRLKLSDNIIIMETGGMKGRRKEMIRTELHEILTDSFGVKSIHSEYGMTELLSQAYSKGNGVFQCPPWMKFLIRESDDPLSYCENGKTGGINIIDLANVYSCPFIATQDLGKKLNNNSFEILGRFDNSDIRGCNLMFSN